jgi:ATP-binding cassette subfamily F protein 3
MTHEKPHVLLLDEPTNHLDVDAREALVQALNDYEGAVVLVSHDPHLIELTADRLWLVNDGRCLGYDGDLDDYRRLLLDQRRERGRDKTSERADPVSRKEKRRAAAENRAATQHLRKAAEAAERDMRSLEQRRSAMEQRLSDPAVYGGPTRDLMDLQLKLGEVKKKIAVAEERWLAAQSALESGEAETSSAGR